MPAGDIGVGARESDICLVNIKTKNTFDGVFTGKGINWGGSLIRPEATVMDVYILQMRC